MVSPILIARSLFLVRISIVGIKIGQKSGGTLRITRTNHLKNRANVRLLYSVNF